MARRPVILDDDEDEDRPRPRVREIRESREGYESGLASTFIGATFLIIAMLVPRLVDRPGYGRGMGVSGMLVLVGIVIAEFICIVSVIFASRGLKQARTDKTPVALPLTGLMLSLFAIFLWMVVGLAVMTDL